MADGSEDSSSNEALHGQDREAAPEDASPHSESAPLAPLTIEDVLGSLSDADEKSRDLVSAAEGGLDTLRAEITAQLQRASE